MIDENLSHAYCCFAAIPARTRNSTNCGTKETACSSDLQPTRSTCQVLPGYVISVIRQGRQTLPSLHCSKYSSPTIQRFLHNTQKRGILLQLKVSSLGAILRLKDFFSKANLRLGASCGRELRYSKWKQKKEQRSRPKVVGVVNVVIHTTCKVSHRE